MTRFAALLLAAASLVAATPAFAGSYSAKPVAAPTAARIIAHDISWTCGPDACQGNTEESRPAILCQGLAKRAGHLDSFIANGRAARFSSGLNLATLTVSPSGRATPTTALPNPTPAHSLMPAMPPQNPRVWGSAPSATWH